MKKITEAVRADVWWMHCPPAAEIYEINKDQGLSSTQAYEGLVQFGPNRISDSHTIKAWKKYLLHFQNPLVLILIAASILSIAVGELANFIIILCIVLISVTLDFVQEYRANAAAEKLKQSMALHSSVMRDGQIQTILSADIVPGDLIQLKAGDLVPADGYVVEARDCFVNQSSLTGESYPVEKRMGMPAGIGADIQEATHAVFMGSSVLSGSASVCIVKTGSATIMGQIADSVAATEAPTSFEVGARHFNMMIMRLTMWMVLFVLLVNLLSHKNWLDSFLFAIALAVGLTPELLPMVVSVTLARGALRMAKQGVIVKRQSSIQDLGSMDVLCTDKTGTLTESLIRMESHVDASGVESTEVLRLAYLNSWFETGLRNPMDEAILKNNPVDVSEWKKIDEIPFDFERRRVSVLVENSGERTLVVKGAPDEILRFCTYRVADDSVQTLLMDEAAELRARKVCSEFEDQGFRVLGIAYRKVSPNHSHADINDESELVLAGFCAFLDPPKKEAGDTLRALAPMGVEVKVLTGDSERVTRHIYAQFGIPVTGVLLGHEMEKLDDFALRARIRTVNLFCRVSPSQKSRIIHALRASGHVVGYMGDGVNDAPSLHAADVGLSVESAVDVAKAAADMILSQKDLSVLREAIIEGRRTFRNIMKYIMMGTSSNFGNMFSMAGASLFLPFLPMLPAQILLNNLLYDLSEIAIPFDTVEVSEMNTPAVLDMKLLRDFMWAIGPVSSLFDFITFGALLMFFEADQSLFQTGWFVESLFTQVLVIFVIRTRINPLKTRPHPWLIVTSVAVLAIAIGLPYTAIGLYFGFTPLPAAFFVMLTMMVLLYLLAVEFVKRRFFLRHSINNQPQYLIR
jgi:Mg2+-importing ATPase